MIHVIIISPDEYKQVLCTEEYRGEPVKRIYIEECGITFLFFVVDNGLGEKKLLIPQNTSMVCNDAILSAVKRLSSGDYTSSL